jgi:hypothetical protein
MTETEHVFEPDTNWFADIPYLVVPSCSCGWKSRGNSSYEAAEKAWERHCADAGAAR